MTGGDQFAERSSILPQSRGLSSGLHACWPRIVGRPCPRLSSHHFAPILEHYLSLLQTSGDVPSSLEMLRAVSMTVCLNDGIRSLVIFWTIPETLKE